MRRDLAALLAASALYGFSIGSLHSTRFGLHDVLKFPLLFLVTGAVCAVAYFLCGCLIGGFRFRFGDIQRLAMRLYRDAALLLAALAPANLFLARTLVPPDAASLHEYPMFLGLNVGFIAVAGALALVRQVRALAAYHPWSLPRRLTLVAGWLALSLLVGGQAAWTLRPFFGVRSIPGAETRFFLGSSPDYRGSTNFYEAVYDVVTRPPLASDYVLRGRGGCCAADEQRRRHGRQLVVDLAVLHVDRRLRLDVRAAAVQRVDLRLRALAALEGDLRVEDRRSSLLMTRIVSRPLRFVSVAA